MSPIIHRISNRALRVTLAWFSDYAVAGRNNIPSAGSLLVVANHQSNMDPPILAASLRRDTRFLAKEEMFRGVSPLGRWFLKTYGAYPVRRGRIDVGAVRWTLKQLSRPGSTIAIFPEGTRNPGSLKKAQSGVVTLALRAGVPILPVGLTGVEGMHSWLRVFKPKGTLRVRIGQPFRLEVTGPLSAEEIESVTTEIMGRVAATLPESYRGYYEEAAGESFKYTTTIRPDGSPAIFTPSAESRQ